MDLWASRFVASKRNTRDTLDSTILSTHLTELLMQMPPENVLWTKWRARRMQILDHLVSV